METNTTAGKKNVTPRKATSSKAAKGDAILSLMQTLVERIERIEGGKAGSEAVTAPITATPTTAPAPAPFTPSANPLQDVTTYRSDVATKTGESTYGGIGVFTLPNADKTPVVKLCNSYNTISLETFCSLLRHYAKDSRGFENGILADAQSAITLVKQGKAPLLYTPKDKKPATDTAEAFAIPKMN